MIEQAFYLTKMLPAGTFFSYYLGTMPFIIGILYFFNDMSKNAFAHEYCLSASLGLAFLFAWMRTWQAIFSIKTYEFIGQYPERSWSFGSVAHLITTQTIVHASAILILPLASFILVPFAWVFAMYQMVLVQDEPDHTIKSLLKNNFFIATKHTFVNHSLIGILSGFELFVFLNIAIAIYTLPFLAKSLLGIESSFTMGGFNMFNTTFLLSACCITHLLVDPLIKIVYAIQKYNSQSLKTGDDLISELGRLKHKTKIKTLVPILLVCFFMPGILPSSQAAETTQVSNPIFKQAASPEISRASIPSKELDKAVKKILSRREYTWRMPKDKIKKQDEPHGFIYTALKWVASQIKTAGEAVAAWLEKIYEWFRKLFEQDKKPLEPKDPESLIKPGHLATGLIVLVIILLSAIFLHFKKLKPEKPAPPENTEKIILDINDENILADSLPGDQWLALARDLLEKKELRLAIRALYLGILALLADRHLVKIARHKSNRDYQLELSSKNPEPKTLIDDFTRIVQTVDSVWYGMHAVNQDMIDTFLSTQHFLSTSKG